MLTHHQGILVTLMAKQKKAGEEGPPRSFLRLALLFKESMHHNFP